MKIKLCYKLLIVLIVIMLWTVAISQADYYMLVISIVSTIILKKLIL
jgi:hypothetical protein